MAERHTHEIRVSLPADLPQTALEGIQEYIECWQERFTGTVATEFTQGVPVLRRKTDTKRFGAMGERMTG